MPDRSLEGRVAVITGGSRGLGRAMAVALGAEGATIALVARDEAKLNETAEAVRRQGSRAEIHLADVSSEEQVEALASKLGASHGKVQILVNNAGINIRKQITEFTLE